MGISSTATLENKRVYRTLIDRYADLREGDIREAVRAFHHPHTIINVVQPVNEVDGVGDYLARVLDPMLDAFDNLYRRTDMLFGGKFDGAEWVVSHGHYVGTFARDWLGIPANGDIVWLHYLEYHRMEDGRATQTYLYLDLIDLLRQIGRWPLPPSNGYEGFVPGPATCDGIVMEEQEPGESGQSLKMVEEMLARLYTEDEGWRSYWHRNMYWYGPSGYGSYLGVGGFARFQLPYESIFEPEQVASVYRRSTSEELNAKIKGHFARFADGNYVASGGWPSHGGFMVNDWLGVKAARQMFTVRVADIWRRQGDSLIENWVFVDLVDMLLQLGVDVFEKAGIRIRV